MLRIDKVRIEVMPDDDTASIDLGSYSDTPDSVYFIDRQERGDKGRNELRYFNPRHENYKGEPVDDIAKYCEQDYQRMEAYNRGDWSMVGIRAVAEVSYRLPGSDASRRLETLHSGGLWGIATDSGRDYLETVAGDELDDLRQHLAQFGIVCTDQEWQRLSCGPETFRALDDI